MKQETVIYNFGPFKRGDTFPERHFQLTEEINGVDTPVDLSGATMCMQLKKDDNSPASFEFSTANNRIVIYDAANGFFKMIRVLLALEPFPFKQDFQINLATGDILTYFEGNFIIEGDISVP